ncbi:MAG TPA: DNA helicase RecG, partial [Archangium sp.]
MERTLAGATGVDAEALKHLRAALPHVDDPTVDRRKAALRRVLTGLKLSGVQLPEELAQVASTTPTPPQPHTAPTTPLPSGEGRGEGSSRPGLDRRAPDRVPAWKSADPAPPAPGTKSAPAKPAMGRGPSAPMVTKPAPEGKPEKRKKRVAKGQEESRSEAKLLSIAPRSGPLAIPLKT